MKDDLVERVALAMRTRTRPVGTMLECEDLARAALAIARPAILEEAAAVWAAGAKAAAREKCASILSIKIGAGNVVDKADAWDSVAAKNAEIARLRAEIAERGKPVGLSVWAGWDQSRPPWSESKHKDAVCGAVFRAPWSMEDAAELIGFIDRTWPLAHTTGQEPAPTCPICAEPFKADDICATDINEGTCHAECLEGSPVVYLDTGEPSEGPIDTFRYGQEGGRWQS